MGSGRAVPGIASPHASGSSEAMPDTSSRGAAGSAPAGGASPPKGGAEPKDATAAGPACDHMPSLAFEVARDMMMLARVEPGPEFRVESVNRRYVETVRAAGIAITAETVVGRTFAELKSVFNFAPAAWEEILARYRRVVETRAALDYDEVSDTPNGVFYGQTTLTPVCDDAGACRFVLYASTDTTSRKRAEAAQRESEEKFAKAFRASPGAMAISDPGGRGFIEVNDGYTRMFGYTREELIGRRTVDLGLWVHADQRLKFLDEFRAKGSVREMEVVRRRRDGTHVTCFISAETLLLGGRQCIVTALYDITPRLRAEKALRESEEKFSKAFRAAPGALFISDIESGRIVDANEGCERIFGYVRTECIGRTTAELQVLEDPADRVRLIEKMHASGGAVRDFEMRGRTRAGGTVTVSVSCETIELDGRPHMVTAVHDITQRKQAEQALRESEKKFSQAFRAGPGAVGITELRNRTYVEVNDAYCQMFG